MTELTYIGTRKTQQGKTLYLYRRDQANGRWKLAILQESLIPVLIGSVMEVDEPSPGKFSKHRIRLLEVKYDALAEKWKRLDGKVI